MITINAKRVNSLGFKLVSISVAILMIGCIEGSNITGSDDVIEVLSPEFEVTELIGGTSSLTAKGTITNSSATTTYYAPWYVEGEFYSDANYDFKLGGDKYTITFSLAPGEATGWQLSFSSSLYIESDYPNFAVKNLRAYTDPVD